MAGLRNVVHHAERALPRRKGSAPAAGNAGAPLRIGTLNEGPLHEALKLRYAAQRNASLECPVGRYVADVHVADPNGGRLVEVQTRGFGALNKKLSLLLQRYPVTLVYPIAEARYIVKLAANGRNRVSRRRSPRRGRLIDVFAELVYAPELIGHKNLTLDVVFTREEETRVLHGGKGRRRRGWVVAGRNLIAVSETMTFHSPAALVEALASPLPDRFTTRDIALLHARPRRLAQQMAYCLRAWGLVTVVGKTGNALVYELA